MNGPDIYPAVARQMAEKVELMRMAYLSAMARADAGQDVDPHYLQSARAFLAANPPIRGALSSGEPA